MAPLPGYKILNFYSITDREDIRIAGVHLIIHPDPPAFADLQPGLFCQFGIRAHADGQDHNIRRIGFTGFRFHINNAGGILLKSGSTISKCQFNSMPL